LAHVREKLSALQHELSAPRVPSLSRVGPEPPPKPTEIGYDHLVAVPLNVHSASPELYRERVLEIPKIHAVPPAGRTRIKSAQNCERNCSTCSVCGHLKYIEVSLVPSRKITSIPPLALYLWRNDVCIDTWAGAYVSTADRLLKLRAFKHLRDCG
jgi:hypothetical protein